MFNQFVRSGRWRIAAIPELGVLVALRRRTRDLLRRLAKSVRETGRRLSARRRANLQAQQIGGQIHARTADDVSVELGVAVRYYAPLHYGVLPVNADDAFSDLDTARVRFDASIANAVLTCIPSMKFDDLFARREEIAEAVQRELAPVMDRFGYEILDALIIGIRTAGASEGGRSGAAPRTAELQDEPLNGRAVSRWESEGGHSGS